MRTAEDVAERWAAVAAAGVVMLGIFLVEVIIKGFG
jgi:hypothetical protein